MLLAGVFNRLGQLTSIAGDLPVAPKLKKRSKPPAPFPTPASLIEALRRAQDTDHHAAIEVAVEEAQARWLAEQEEVSDAEQR